MRLAAGDTRHACTNHICTVFSTAQSPLTATAKKECRWPKGKERIAVTRKIDEASCTCIFVSTKGCAAVNDSRDCVPKMEWADVGECMDVCVCVRVFVLLRGHIRFLDFLLHFFPSLPPPAFPIWCACAEISSALRRSISCSSIVFLCRYFFAAFSIMNWYFSILSLFALS